MPAPKCRHGCPQSGNARWEIPPFADGNSRSQYELFRRIAFRAGWNIDTARVDLAALSAARYVTAETGDPRLLADVLAPVVVSRREWTPAPTTPGRPVLSPTSHLAMMRDYDRDRSGPYTAAETFREVPRERDLRGAELDNAHALVRLGLALAERTDYGPAHDKAVRRILDGTSTLATERAATRICSTPSRAKPPCATTPEPRSTPSTNATRRACTNSSPGNSHYEPPTTSPTARSPATAANCTPASCTANSTPTSCRSSATPPPIPTR